VTYPCGSTSPAPSPFFSRLCAQFLCPIPFGPYHRGSLPPLYASVDRESGGGSRMEPLQWLWMSAQRRPHSGGIARRIACHRIPAMKSWPGTEHSPPQIKQPPGAGCRGRDPGVRPSPARPHCTDWPCLAPSGVGRSAPQRAGRVPAPRRWPTPIRAPGPCAHGALGAGSGPCAGAMPQVGEPRRGSFVPEPGLALDGGWSTLPGGGGAFWGRFFRRQHREGLLSCVPYRCQR
jgi:hypothetical protein